MTTTPHTLGSRLRTWRERNGLSCADVGVSLHLEPGLVACIEAGCIPGSAQTQATIKALIAPDEPPPTAAEDALMALLRTAITEGWAITLQRGSVGDAIRAVVDEG